jgi:arylsulfatase A-like enzyme
VNHRNAPTKHERETAVGKEADKRARPGDHALTALGAALAVGALGGALLGIRESVRVVLQDPATAARLHYAEVLRFGGYAVWRYAVLGTALMLVVGLGLMLLVGLGRIRGTRPRLWGISAGLLVLLIISALWLIVGEWLLGTMPGRAFLLAEAGAVGALAAVGAACVVGALYERLAFRRLLALALGLLVAAFVLANWGLWLYLAALPGRGRLAVRGGEAAVLLAAVGLGGGLYGLLGAESRRRRCLGIAALAAGASVWATAHTLLAPTAEAQTGTAPRGARKRPNVLFIVLDTARADVFSCYGCPRETTPHIDAIASEGILYERAIAPAPWTLPSHAAMFTGKLPSHTGTDAEQQFLDDRFTTLAEILAEHGYRTFGYSNNEYVAARYNLAQGFQQFHAFSLGRTWRQNLLANRMREGLHQSDYGAAETNRVVSRWIRQAHAAGQPFFAFINYMEVHHRYGVTPDYRRWLPEDVSPEQALRVNQSIWAYSAGRVPMSAQDWRILRALYDGDATYLDRRIGELVDRLRALGVLDDTLLIITSDHGEHFGEHGLGGHDFSLYDELLHVPLIIRYPQAFPAGQRVPRLVSLLDLFPTILDAAGIEWQDRDTLHGRSLLPPAEADEVTPAVSECAVPLHVLHHLQAAYPPCDARRFLRRLKSIHDGQHKYIWTSDGQEELYNVRRDPLEAKNLIRQHPEKARQLRAALENRLGRPLDPTAPVQTQKTPGPAQ